MQGVVLSHIEKYIEDLPYPLMGNSIKKISEKWNVPENVRETIDALPNKTFKSAKELKLKLQNLPFDDGVPKINNTDKLVRIHNKDQQTMKFVARIGDFTQMGDEQNQEA